MELVTAKQIAKSLNTFVGKEYGFFDVAKKAIACKMEEHVVYEEKDGKLYGYSAYTPADSLILMSVM